MNTSVPLRERLWHSRLGQRVCLFVTNGEHVFSGWDTPMHPLGPVVQTPMGPARQYPYAYCDRCGADF